MVQRFIILFVALLLVGCSGRTPATTAPEARPTLVPGDLAVPGRDVDLNAVWNALPDDFVAYGIRQIRYIVPDRFLIQQEHGAQDFLYFVYDQTTATIHRLTTAQHNLEFQKVEAGRLYFRSQGHAASAYLQFPFRLIVPLPPVGSQADATPQSTKEPLWLPLEQGVTIGQGGPRVLQGIEGADGALRLRFDWPPGVAHAGGDHIPRVTLRGGSDATFSIKVTTTTATDAVLGDHAIQGVPGVRSARVRQLEAILPPQLRIDLELEPGIRAYSVPDGMPATAGQTLYVQFRKELEGDH